MAPPRKSQMRITWDPNAVIAAHTARPSGAGANRATNYVMLVVFMLVSEASPDPCLSRRTRSALAPSTLPNRRYYLNIRNFVRLIFSLIHFPPGLIYGLLFAILLNVNGPCLQLLWTVGSGFRDFTTVPYDSLARTSLNVF